MDERRQAKPSGLLARQRSIKVPVVITALFWLTKVSTTALGETTSDFLVHRINPYVAVPITGTAMLIVLAVQLALPRYNLWIYWLCAAMVAVAGTVGADVTHIELHIPYVVSTISFALALALLFVCWHRVERTLSIHSISTLRRELFYWATVITTFALGTAAGDMTARSFHLGYLASGILFTAIIAIPAIGYWRFGMNAVLAFWFAYVLTRPVGASFADYVGMPVALGGLGVGTGPVSLVLALLTVALVALQALRGHAAGAATA